MGGMWNRIAQSHMLRVVAGWSCIVLGLLGCVLPILQGFLFLAIGAALLAPYVPFFRRLRIVLLRRLPRMRKKIYRYTGG